jgi:hypothetical protein
MRSGHWELGLTATTCVLGSSLAVPLRFYNYYSIGATLCQPLFYNFFYWVSLRLVPEFTHPRVLVHICIPHNGATVRSEVFVGLVLRGQLAT